MPADLNKPIVDYLCDLRERLAAAQGYANAHLAKEQKRWIARYNLRSRDKQFSDGESVMILMPDDSSSRMWSRWKAPAKIINRVSDYSYLVEYDGSRHVIHANKLRRYNVRVNSVQCHAASYIDGYVLSDINICTVIREEHDEFGHVPTVDACANNLEELLPSQKIDSNGLSHLSTKERRQLLNVLDRYPSCFSEKAGVCTLVEHEMIVKPEFRPKRMKPYRIPEMLKPEVEKQIIGSGCRRMDPDKPLKIIEWNKPFIMRTDASDIAIAGSLSQESTDGFERPISFYSKKLTSAQKAWPIIEREAFAVLEGLKRFNHWIFGHQIFVYSDQSLLS